MTARKDGSLRSARTFVATAAVLTSGVGAQLALGINAVAAAAIIRSATFIQMMGLRSAATMSCTTTRVPTKKAADAAARISPYSNRFPAIRGLAALTVRASASDVVGARPAA